MSKKTAELSSNLVAIKGAAVPAPDMPGRVVAASADPVVHASATSGKAGEGAAKEAGTSQLHWGEYEGIDWERVHQGPSPSSRPSQQP